MKRRIWVIAAGLVVLGAFGVYALTLAQDVGRSKFPTEARDVFEHADRLILFGTGASAKVVHSIPGMKPLPYLGALPGRVITDSAIKDRIVRAIYAGIGDPKASGKKCFEPHHAIRAERGKQLVDLIICFKCDWVYVLANGKRTPLETSVSPMATLDGLLK